MLRKPMWIEFHLQKLACFTHNNAGIWPLRYLVLRADTFNKDMKSPVKLKTVNGNGTLAGIDLDDSVSLLDIMES